MISLLVILSSAKVCGGRNCLTSKIDRDQYSQTYGYHKVKFSANSNVNVNFDISLMSLQDEDRDDTNHVRRMVDLLRRSALNAGDGYLCLQYIVFAYARPKKTPLLHVTPTTPDIVLPMIAFHGCANGTPGTAKMRTA